MCLPFPYIPDAGYICESRHACGWAELTWVLTPCHLQGSRSFWNHTVQPESGLLVNYYGLPSISMRDVWFHHWARNEPGFLSRDIMCSINHPNYLGHLCASQYSTDSLCQCQSCPCAG